MSLTEKLESVNSALADAWGMLFMKKATIETHDGEPSLQVDASGLTDKWVCAKISFSGDISGETHYYFSAKQALTMVGMMMSMGSDDALIDSTIEGELGEDEIDALQEAFGQLSATAATVLREALDIGLKSNLEGVTVVTPEGAFESITEEDYVCSHELELEGYEKEVFYQVLSQEFGNLIESGPQAEEEEAPMVEAEVAPVKEDPVEVLNNIKGLTVSSNVILAERKMPLSELMKLSQNSIIEFWKPCDHPAELTIEDTVLANGEVVTADQHFGLRLLNIGPQPLGTYQKGM